MGRILEFRIGDAFPANDPVARWLTVLAMASNDFFRMFRWVEEAESEGTRLLAFRIQAAAIFEAATHVVETLRLVPEVATFVHRLSVEATNHLDRVIAALDEKSEHEIASWAEPHRNVTFHYPAMHPEKAAHGKEEIKKALEAAADLPGSITADDTFGSVRFGFADEVAVQLLPEADPSHAPALEAVRDAGLALASFVQEAATAYLMQLPDGTARLRRTDAG